MPSELKLTLETVTPLFLGGADPRGAPELRPPSLRGAMRYWLRAALGGVIGDQDLDGLRKLENSVFGSTDCGSPIHLRLKPIGDKVVSGNEKILPHKQGQAGFRQAIKAGQQLELTLSTPYRVSTEVWHAAITALRLTTTFGGIGLRSRRGYGTLKVVASSDQNQMPISPDSLAGWKQFVIQAAENAIHAGRQLAQMQGVSVLAGPPSGLTRFPCASNESLIMITDLKVVSAMQVIVNVMQRVPNNHAFGGINPRQASPLWVRPIKTSDDHYGLLFLVLASDLRKYTNYKHVQKFLEQHFHVLHLQARGWNV